MRTRQLETGQRRNLFARLLDIINHQLPSALIQRRNPLFERQLKLLKWPPTSRMSSRFIPISKMAVLKEYTFRVGCFIPLVFSILITAATIGGPNNYLLFILFAAVAFGLLCSVYYVLAAINTIYPQSRNIEWESLRLTLLTEADILMANYATIQVRVWRTMVVEVAVRVFLSLVCTLELIQSYLSALRYSSPNGVEAFEVILAFVIIVTAFIVEPLWRMRTVTLIGITMATWFQDYGAALIAAIAGVLGLVIAEIIVISCTLWINFAFAISAFFNFEYSDTGNAALMLPFFVLCATLPICGLYLLFRLVRLLVSARLERVAFRG